MSSALAHGNPALSAKESVVAPGGRVTLSGDALGEAGQIVALTLRGANYQATLGTVRLKTDGFDDTVFTIPQDVPAGTYVILGKNGQITANTQIEVTVAPAHSAGTTAAQTVAIQRPRTPLEWGVEIGLVVLTGAVAIVLLWRSRSDLTAIDR